MNSKMFSWIKKRCRRRPDDKLKCPDETNLRRCPYPSIDSPLYFRVPMSPFKKIKEQDAYEYDEVYDETTLSPKEITNLLQNQKIDTAINQRVCPLCRSSILTDYSCKCAILRRNLRSQKPKICQDVSLNSLLQIKNDSNRSHPFDGDSSGYESVGSDSMSSGDIYSENSVTTDSDDGYETVEFNPSLAHERQYSVGSLHTLMQRTKLPTARAIECKGRQPAFQRTKFRRSLEGVGSRKSYQ